MIRTLLSGGCLFALAAGSTATQANYDVPSELFIENAECAIGAGLQYAGNGSQADLEAYLGNVAALRQDSIDAMSSGLTNDGNGNGHDDDDDDDDDDGDDDTQVVFLEFNPGAPDFPVLLSSGGVVVGALTFNDYIYTQEDKDLIQQRLEADYDEYDYEFTQVQPTSGEYSTLTYGDNDAGNITLDIDTGGINILFGRADNIDFRNDDRDDNAFIDASLWRFLADLDRANGSNNLGNLSGIEVTSPADIDAVEQLAVQNQSSNTGSHELGHIQGLRHHDSLGAPGDGLSPAMDPADWLPIGETDTNAFESFDHIMASGASVGLSLQGSTIADRFFSERSALKLAFNDKLNKIQTEQKAKGKLKFKGQDIPNTLLSGVNAGAELEAKLAVVEGRLDAEGEVDAYRFKGKAGQVFNAEIISFSDVAFAEPIIGLLVLSLEQDGGLVEIARNRLTFEGIEPMIFDITLPEKGDYVLEVSSPATIDFGGGAVFPLELFGLGGFEIGDYDLYAYRIEAEFDDDDDDDDD